MKKIIALIVSLVMILGIVSVHAESSPEKVTLYTLEGDASDLLTIEEVWIQERPVPGLGVLPPDWTIKVRNTSGEDLKMNESSMRIWFRYLDENYDTLHSTYVNGGYSETIKAGRATQITTPGYPGEWTDADFAKVEYLEFYGYTTDLSGAPKYEFTEMITVNVGEYFDRVDYK